MFNPIRRLALASLPLLATLTMGTMGAVSAHAQAVQPQRSINSVAPIIKTNPVPGHLKVVHHAHHLHHKAVQNKIGANQAATNKAASNQAATNKAATNKAGNNKLAPKM